MKIPEILHYLIEGKGLTRGKLIHLKSKIENKGYTSLHACYTSLNKMMTNITSA